MISPGVVSALPVRTEYNWQVEKTRFELECVACGTEVVATVDSSELPSAVLDCPRCGLEMVELGRSQITERS